MPNIDPAREFHDELLSAYLDGELSPSERSRVEERLVVDPVARQMLDDLRSVSRSVQGLPHERLGEDLRSAILQRAQEAMSSSAGVRAISPAALAINRQDQSANSDNSLSQAEPRRPHVPIGRTRRGWVWAALAVAAAVMIMVVERGDQRDAALPDVARRDGDASVQNELSTRGIELRPIKDRAEVAAASEGTDPLSNGGLARIEADNGAPPPAESISIFPRPDGTEGRLSGGRLILEEEAEAALSNDLALNRESAADAFGVNLAETVTDKLSVGAPPAAQPGPAVRIEQVAEAENRDLSNRRSLSAIDEAAPSGNDGAARQGGAGGQSNALGATVNRADASDSIAINTPANPTVPNPSDRDGLMVVYLNVKREALNGRAFDQQLRRNQIAFEAAPAARGQSAGVPIANAGTSAEVSELARDYYAYWSSTDSLDRGVQESDAVLVEAPQAQIEQLIGELVADSENVVSISIAALDSSGAVADASQLAGVDWSEYQRVSILENLSEVRQRETNGAVLALDADEASAALAFEPAGRGRGGRGGRRGRGVGGAAGSGEASASGAGGFGGGGGGRGGRAAADTAQQQSQQASGEPLSRAASDAPAQVESQPMPRSGEVELGFSTRAGANEINRGRGEFAGQAVDGRESVTALGRAKRLVLSTADDQPLQSNRFFETASPADGRGGGAQSGGAVSTGMLDAKEQSDVATGYDLALGNRGSSGQAARPAADEPSTRAAVEPSARAAVEPSARAAVEAEISAGGRFARVGAQYSAPPRAPLQVLFVFRVAPESAAPSTPGGPSTPATIPAAADPPK